MLSFNKLPKQVAVSLKITGLLLSLYFFIVGVCGMGDAFTMFGGDFAEKVMGATKNPLAALMMGFLATSIMQSSAATITIVVGMVAGNVLSISAAVPMIMGANIGTTITAMLVSFACVRKKDEFERAYGAALLHLAFNVITTLLIFPLEATTGILSRLAGYGTMLFQRFGGMVICNPLKLATQPAIEVVEKLCFHNAVAFLIVMTVLMYATLAGLVSILQGMVMVKVEKFFDKVLFSSWQRSMLFGVFLTATIQTSSVTTSLAITLVGAGAMKLSQSYPFTLGSNLGTTITTFIAALATASPFSITVAFSHVLFNIVGILIIWPFPAIRRLPLDLVTATARWCVKIRFMPIIFIVAVYFLLPATVLFIIH